MPDNGLDLRRISWTQTFPFVRLFRTFKLAINPTRLMLAFCCVLVCYVGGRILDTVWPESSGVIRLTRGDDAPTEIHAYASLTDGRGSSDEIDARRRSWDRNRQQAETAAVVMWVKKEDGQGLTREEAEKRLESESAADLIHAAQEADRPLGELLDVITAGLAAKLKRIDADEALNADEKTQRRDIARQAADYLRLTLDGHDAEDFATPEVRTRAIELVASTEERATTQEAKDQADLRKAVDRSKAITELAQMRRAGPFIALVGFETDCFAALIQGVCQGRFSMSGGVTSPQPAVLGSAASGLRGLLWFVTQRPGYAVVYGIFALIVGSFFGGAVCRSAAVQSAREESASLGSVLRFVRDKYAGFALAPVFPLGMLLIGGLVVTLGSLIGAIPWLGEIVAGLFYFLALLGCFALALVAVCSVLGFPLMWPTIAVEGSDAFDAVSHAFSFVLQRIWHTLFYGAVLLVYGGLAFVVVRVIVLVLLKLTHGLTGAGMSLFGGLSSADTDTFAKLDAMWQMPAWADLAILPRPGAVPLWGTFDNAPLNGTETIGMWLIAIWVFFVVGLLTAFAFNLFHCGGVEAYYLLRREVDGTDWDDVYYDDDDDDFGMFSAQAEETGAESTGTALPVVGAQPPAPAAAATEPDAAEEGPETEAPDAEDETTKPKPRRKRRKPPADDSEGGDDDSGAS